MSAELDYVAVKPCGCWVCWASATMPPKDLARDVAAWMRRGLSIQRATTEEARQRLKMCECRKFTSKADFSPLGAS